MSLEPGSDHPVRVESGMTTAEYAVGTLGACTVAGVLVHLGTSDWFGDLVGDVLSRALDPRLLVDLIDFSSLPRFRYGP